MAKGNNISKTAVWVLMGLLILGLGGFGATNLSGTLRTIGSVGEKPLAIDIYARMLQQEIRSFEAQTGNTLTFQQVQAMGLDQAVLNRFIQTRALDHEAAQMGLSVGDETLRSRILEVRAFQGINGSFDRDTYRFALEQAGISEAQFETQLREEIARTLLQGAVVSGVEMPAGYVDTLVKFIAEERSFTWAKLDASHLAAPLGEPTQDDLQGHYDAHIADFTLPQTKRITYAWLSPEMIAQQITVADSEVQAAYDARAEDFNQPERRLVERLVFLDEPNANQARAALDSGTGFDTLVSDRGLTLADVDLGDLTREDLGTAADAVFTAEVGQIVGPLPSDLGPALFRVNAVLPAQITALDDVRGDLTRELAMDAAARQIDARAEGLNDLMAAGATLEELASETDMQSGAIDWTQETQDGIAAYEAFRLAAQALSAEDFPEILLLEDGGVFAMRLDETLPPRPAPFETVRADVAQQWRNAQTVSTLTQQIQPLIPQLSSGTSFAEAGFDAVAEENLTRNGFVAGTPQGFLQGVFSLQRGEVSILGGVDGVFVARLDQIHAPAQSSEAQALATQVEGQINQALAQDLFEIYATDVIQRAGPSVDPRAVQAVHANFP